MKSSKALSITLVLAVVVATIGFLRWSHSPLHAISTDRAGSVIICTARCDAAVEAMFFFDTSTGVLEGFAACRYMDMQPQSRWLTNVSEDMLAAAIQLGVEIPHNPKFTMVSGAINAYATRGNVRPSLDTLFVTEVTSGLTIVYTIPWNSTLHSSNTPFSSPLRVWTVTRFATGAPVDPLEEENKP